MENSLELSQLCYTLFSAVNKQCILFAPLLFIGKLAYYNISGGSKDDIITVCKGVLLYFLLVISFEYILELLFSIPLSFIADFSFSKVLNSPSESHTVLDSNTSSLPTFLRRFMETINSFLFYAATFIYVLLMVLLSSLAPVIFLLTCLLGVGVGLQTFFGLIIIASCWPLIWVGFDQLTDWFSKQNISGFSKLCYEMMTYILKIAGPITVAKLSVSSNIGTSIVSTMSSGLNSFKNTASFTASHSKKLYQPMKAISSSQFITASSQALRNRTSNMARAISSQFNPRYPGMSYQPTRSSTEASFHHSSPTSSIHSNKQITKSSANQNLQQPAHPNSNNKNYDTQTFQAGDIKTNNENFIGQKPTHQPKTQKIKWEVKNELQNDND